MAHRDPAATLLRNAWHRLRPLPPPSPCPPLQVVYKRKGGEDTLNAQAGGSMQTGWAGVGQQQQQQPPAVAKSPAASASPSQPAPVAAASPVAEVVAPQAPMASNGGVQRRPATHAAAAAASQVQQPRPQQVPAVAVAARAGAPALAQAQAAGGRPQQQPSSSSNTSGIPPRRATGKATAAKRRLAQHLLQKLQPAVAASPAS